MPYAQATVIRYDNNYIGLRSYQTIVAMIDDKGVLTVRGLYSATTRKHIGAFVREYANTDYQTAKRICEDCCGYNIYTGEVVKL
jgi:hypothetical protein